MEKPKVIINRYWGDGNQTSGTCTVLIDGKPKFASMAIERGWQDNKNNISCVPEGTYKLALEYSPKFRKKLWEIKDVPERTECKFHAANYWFQLNGCIALGVRGRDLNNDNYLDVSMSKNAMNEFHYVLRDYQEAILIIRNFTDEI